MGAVKFFEVEEGKTREEAFGKLVHEALEEYGTDSYNGTISTTELVGDTVIIASKYSESIDKKGKEYAEKDDYGNKWESKCLDLGVSGYSIETVEKKLPDKNANKTVYETKYVLFLEGDGYCRKSADMKHFYDTKKEAEEAAIEIARGSGFSVSIHKQKVPVSGNDAIETITVSSQIVEKHPKKKDFPRGTIVSEIHTYAFYGWAGC